MKTVTRDERKREWIKCSLSPVYFCSAYVQIYNATMKEWIPFQLWPAQREVITTLASERYVIMLKARQLGMSWLTLAYALWLMVFHPSPSIMLMSKRDDESMELLARLRDMHTYLPDWMQPQRIEQNAAHDYAISTGSKAKAFPTSGGRSYTGSLVLLDEADFLPDLNKVLLAIKPTIDAGGQLIMISTVDKEKPLSPFKQLFREAYFNRGNNYYPIFLNWEARPDRTAAWRAQIALDMFTQTGTNDGLYQEYPDTVDEALAPIEKNKRIPYEWIRRCTEERAPIEPVDAPAIPGLLIYSEPNPGTHYVIGADPAEGNPNSDDSAGCIIDADTWSQVAVLRGKWEPKAFAGFLDLIGVYYNYASVMVERNNHGHALILALRASGTLTILRGHSADAEKAAASERLGWLNNEKGKTLMYDSVAQQLKDQSLRLCDPATIDQLSSIEGDTLAAPEGMNDDLADAYALAVAALQYRDQYGEPSRTIPAPDPLVAYDTGAW